MFNFETDFAPLTPHPLRAVSVASNKLAELPERISDLSRTLEELDVEHNELEALPQGVRALVHLRSLTLSRNYLATFPSQITA